MTEDILHKLQERVKELTALHRTARILQDETKGATEVMREVLALLPPAWQYPEITSARISFQNLIAETSGFSESSWKQAAAFVTRGGQQGKIEIFYGESRPEADEGPFLREERDLIESLAEMLRSYFQHLQADEALQQAHDNLEQTVAARTRELKEANTALEANQQHLRRLTSELALAEARERRAIAEDLHDHIGQALAFTKMSVSQFRGNAIFCGFETKIDDIMKLLDQTIQYTRNLTFTISPPVLYELGLGPALEWLGDQFHKKHGVKVSVRGSGTVGKLSDELQITLFKAVQELLTNSVKHAQAKGLTVTAARSETLLSIEVADDGCGFDFEALERNSLEVERFGLFNIRERLHSYGGRMDVASAPGKGTRITLVLPITRGKDV
jgi:two-component system, NarL family, sensor kinase